MYVSVLCVCAWVWYQTVPEIYKTDFYIGAWFQAAPVIYNPDIAGELSLLSLSPFSYAKDFVVNKLISI